MDGGTSPTDDVQRRNLILSRTRLEFNDSSTKNRTDATSTNRLTNVHRKDEWIDSSTSVLHVGILTAASCVCSRLRPSTREEWECLPESALCSTCKPSTSDSYSCKHVVLRSPGQHRCKCRLPWQVWCTLITGNDASQSARDPTIRDQYALTIACLRSSNVWHSANITYNIQHHNSR